MLSLFLALCILHITCKDTLFWHVSLMISLRLEACTILQNSTENENFQHLSIIKIDPETIFPLLIYIFLQLSKVCTSWGSWGLNNCCGNFPVTRWTSPRMRRRTSPKAIHQTAKIWPSRAQQTATIARIWFSRSCVSYSDCRTQHRVLLFSFDKNCWLVFVFVFPFRCT